MLTQKEREQTWAITSRFLKHIGKSRHAFCVAVSGTEKSIFEREDVQGEKATRNGREGIYTP
jgi:hypothetical protein